MNGHFVHVCLLRLWDALIDVLPEKKRKLKPLLIDLQECIMELERERDEAIRRFDVYRRALVDDLARDGLPDTNDSGVLRRDEGQPDQP